MSDDKPHHHNPDGDGPRHRNPDYETSIEGAEAVGKRAPNQKLKLLVAYKRAGEMGLTDEEAGANAGLLRSCYWKRCGELRTRGWTARPGDEPTRKGEANVPRIVCVITEDGESYLRTLGYR